MALSKLVDIDLIHMNLKPKDKNEVLSFLATDLFNKGYVKEEYITNVQAREATYPTGLPLGNINCGIPHSEMEFVLKPCISVATLEQPIMFQSMENTEESIPVKLIFMLAIDNGQQQMTVLQELMNLVQNKELLQQMTETNNSEDILSMISNF